jgi:aquaporin Z
VISWRELVAEFAGTALLLAVGLSVVVVDFAPGLPVAGAVTDPDLRRLVTGLLFAATATALVYSPLGRISGGHFNPAVTLAFLHLRKITWPGAVGYAIAQVTGAVLGAYLVVLVWGRDATSVDVGATLPALGGPLAALAAEIAMTFALLLLVLTFVDRPRLMPFTAAAAGVLVVVLAFFGGPVSGTSLNPARSLGPALAADIWTWLWIYLLAPTVGALLAALYYGWRHETVACGKLIHDSAYTCRFLDCRYTPPQHRLHAPR